MLSMLRHRRSALLTLLASCFLASCGDTKSSPDVQPDDVADTASPDTKDVDTRAPGNDCCPTGNCPNLGDMCLQGACVPRPTSADGCYFDGQCATGETCEGETFCACGEENCAPSPGECTFPSGCCGSDADCPGAACVAGACRKADKAGECWRDGECGEGEVCEGAAPTPCSGAGEPGGTPGHCALPGACCKVDAECGAGVCRGGRCVAAAADGHCWGDGECGAGETCLGESLCACTVGASSTGACRVPSTPGSCGKAAEACCAGDSDCADGELCVEGECAKLPNREKDECWVDGHCGVGRLCEGASLCGCKDDGCTASTIGQCRTKTVTCSGDADCPVAMRCVRPDQGLCLEPGGAVGDSQDGVCVEDVDGGCWQAGDCHIDLRCGDEKVCRDPAGCDAPNVPGDCKAKVKRWDCCDAHNDCGPGYQCRNQDSSLTCPPSSSAVCLNEPIFGESCWNVEDCPAGKSCYRVWICGCNGKCYFNNMGQCETPTNCQSDADCGEGWVCAKDPECLSSPCTTISTCQVGGQCQVKVEGGCWNHDECGSGRYCEGLKICPSDTSCAIPDQPGICADRAGLGECCTSFRGCEPGLRCVSVGQRSGCKTDFTSVCVPAVTPGTSCFADDDCDLTQRCEGASICPCGLDDCEGPPRAGACVGR